jgi:predicted TIM-barrel fold metal-dependent hydrolase
MIGGCEVIDFHGHPGRWGTGHMLPEKLFPATDAVGIDRSVLFDIWHPEGRRSNDITAALVAAHPDRFIGFAYVSPLMPATVVPELERAIDQLGLSAIKLYPPFVGVPFSDEIWWPIYEFANDRELVVIWHTGIEPGSAPGHMADVAPRFPKASFVAGHSGNCPPMRRQAIDAAKDNPNVYLETCSTFRTPGVIEELVNEAGADRVLFGSDIPLMDPRSQLGKIITADISDEDKRLVIGGNARRILRLS